MNKKGMNKSEGKGYVWLLKKGYKKEEIAYQKRGIDFICADGKGYEVKRLYGHTIWFHEGQLKRTINENNVVLVFDDDHKEPIAIIPSTELKKDNVIAGIRITVVEKKGGFVSLGLRDSQYEKLKAIKKEGESFSDTVNRVFGVFEHAQEIAERDEISNQENNEDLVSKEDLTKAIKGLESDISVLVRDAVKAAFAEMKGY